MGISRSFGNSLPHAPSDQFRPETAFLLVCDGGLGRYVQVLLRDFVVGFHALPLVLQPCPCSSALQLVASTCYARIASLSPLLSPPPHVARGVFSCLLLAMLFCSWVLGSLPWLFLFLGSWVPSLAVSFFCFQDVVVTLTPLSSLLSFAHHPWLKASLCTSHCDEVKRILSCSRRQLRRELHSPWHRCCCFLASLPASPCP